MNLSPEQQDALRGWVRETSSLADIQKKFVDAFRLSLTYMEVRFLLDDLNLALMDEEEETVDSGSPANAASLEAGAAGFSEGMGEEDSGAVRVEIDRVLKPGSVVSGMVVFSDGEKAAWQIDQFGRLAMDPERKGYQPVSEDIRAFQEQLQHALRKKGI